MVGLKAFEELRSRVMGLKVTVRELIIWVTLLYNLHWLPVKFQIDFKILQLMKKAINGLVPFYLHVLLKLLGSVGWHSLISWPKQRILFVCQSPELSPETVHALYSRTLLYRHPLNMGKASPHVFFKLNLLTEDTPPINMDTFYEPSVSVLMEFDCIVWILYTVFLLNTGIWSARKSPHQRSWCGSQQQQENI